jgi:hypothetical protein
VVRGWKFVPSALFTASAKCLKEMHKYTSLGSQDSAQRKIRAILYVLIAFIAACPPRSRSEVKNAWIYTSTPPYVFMAWCATNYAKCLHR